jgi:hypothetical protein
MRKGEVAKKLNAHYSFVMSVQKRMTDQNTPEAYNAKQILIDRRAAAEAAREQHKIDVTARKAARLALKAAKQEAEKEQSIKNVVAMPTTTEPVALKKAAKKAASKAKTPAAAIVPPTPGKKKAAKKAASKVKLAPAMSEEDIIAMACSGDVPESVLADMKADGLDMID